MYFYLVQKIQLIFKFLGLIFLIGMLWVVFGLLTATLEDHHNENLEYIPTNATVVYRVNGRKLIKETFSTLIFHKDSDLSELIHELRTTDSSFQVKDVGILFNSDIVQFEVEENGIAWTGILVNLSNPRSFEKNIKQYIGENSAFAKTKTVGLILTADQKTTEHALKKKANQFLQKKTAFAQKSPWKDSESLFNLWTHNQTKNNPKLALEVSSSENALEATGSVEIPSKWKALPKTLQPNGFHISSSFVPETVRDSLKIWSKQLGITFPEISGISLNYYGMKIVSDPTFFAAPQFDAYVRTEKPIDVQDLFKNSDPKVVLIEQVTFTINGERYHFQQIDAHSFTIGIHKDLPLIAGNSKLIFCANGDLRRLMKIEGDGLVKRVIEMSPLVSAINRTLRSVGKFDVIVAKENKQGKLKASIGLKEGEWPVNALFKFLIRSKLL